MIVELFAHLLALYAAIALGAVGFGVMFAGSAGAASVARVFFVRPARWLMQQARVAFAWLLVATWTLLARFILRPLFEEIAFWVRVLLRGRAR